MDLGDNARHCECIFLRGLKLIPLSSQFKRTKMIDIRFEARSRMLLVEDDALLADGLSVGLGLHGIDVIVARTVAAARENITQANLAAVILDWMLPDGCGVELLMEWRAANLNLPVILMTARDEAADTVTGLNAGADDYLSKPIDLDVLVARLRALVRRAGGHKSPILRWNALTLDAISHKATWRGVDVDVSKREVVILHALMQRPGQVLTREQLSHKLYGWQSDMDSNVVEVHIHHLRSKLGREVIQTVRGIGYRLGDALL